MRLMPKTEARSKAKLENEELIASNIRLRQYWQSINTKLNNVRESYEPEKLQKLNEFERFCKDLEAQRTKLLTELTRIQKIVENTKEIYYGYVRKKDELMETEYRINEENKKLDLREAFVVDLETKIRNSQ
jgi:hypothetical protein